MANKTFEANIYTPNWEFIAVLKDYISIIWTDRYYEVGDFELVLPYTKENYQIYAVDNYIICNQSDKIMIIEDIITSTSSSGYMLKVKGRSAESLLSRRVTPKEIILNANSTEVADIPITKFDGTTLHSHFAGGLKIAFEECFVQESLEIMSEQNNSNATYGTYENREMPAIRFCGVVSDPFNHIADAICNMNSYGDEYLDIIQSQCEAKDIGFAVYRNFEQEIDRTKGTRTQANTGGLFDLVLYDGWNRTGSYLKNKGFNMETTINNKLYLIPSGIIFSVEFLNIQSSDSNYSTEKYKNYIFVKGDEVHASSSASVDIGEKTANFTEAYTDEDAKYYVTGADLNDKNKDYGIFRRETFTEPGISRGLNTRRKYANRLRAKGQKVLKDLKPKWTLSCEISNVNEYAYREDYYLGDLVRVKDSMDNFDTFRVTEEIISCDASGLKVYPTLEVYNPDKYVIDDSIDSDETTYYGVAIEWRFNGGMLPKTRDTAELIYNIGSKYYNVDYEGGHFTKPKYRTGPNGSILGITADNGTIIDTYPTIDQVMAGLTFSSDNYTKIAERVLGVITYNITGGDPYGQNTDYIVFPSEIGTVSKDPNEFGEYKITKDHANLFYWESHRRFIPFEESFEEEEGTPCIGSEKFDANWVDQIYRITFNHGEGGHYNSYTFGDSYCYINEVDEYRSHAPDWTYGKFYERNRDWNTNRYTYSLMSAPTANWYNTSGSGSYVNYFMRTSQTVLDVIIKDVPYNHTPYPPTVYPDKDYHSDDPKWDPTIVPATEDKTYIARWVKDGEDDEEDGDDDEDWDDEDKEEPNSPVKRKNGKVNEQNIYIGDEETNNTDFFGIGMETFRHTSSRLFDDFKLLDGRMQKVKDGPDQHSRFLYKRNISDNVVLQAFWCQYGSLPGISFQRSDGQCIAQYDFGGDSSLGSGGNNGKICEVTFTNAPVIKKIKGLKALTKNPVASSEGQEEPTWPNNIYDHNWNKITSKPSDWDSTWRNYCSYGQIGAKYGIYCGTYDDLGLIFTPLWVRLGIVDWPIVPFVSGTVPYDTRYTNNALDIATRLNRSYVDTFYGYTGWQWRDIPDGRWDAPARGNGTVQLSGDSAPKFVWTSQWGAMFSRKSGNNYYDLTSMPEDWDTNWQNYYYKSSSSYAPVEKYSGHFGSNDITVWIPGCRFYGEGYRSWGSDWTSQGVFYGSSGGGPRAMIPKLYNSNNSIIVTIIGYTQSQTVKEGTIAVFKVNATTIILSASLSYEWFTSMDGGASWVSTGSGGSTYSFKASQAQDGMNLKCTVTASYSVLGETITGTQDSGIMVLNVADYGTDGKDPSNYEKKTDGKKGNTDPAPEQPKPDPPEPKKDKNGSTTLKLHGKGRFLQSGSFHGEATFEFKYEGGPGSDPNDPPWVDNDGYIHDRPGWKVVGDDISYSSNGGGKDRPVEGQVGPVKPPAELSYEEQAERLKNKAKGKVTDLKSGQEYVNENTKIGEAVHQQSGHAKDNEINEMLAPLGGEKAVTPGG